MAKKKRASSVSRPKAVYAGRVISNKRGPASKGGRMASTRKPNATGCCG